MPRVLLKVTIMGKLYYILKTSLATHIDIIDEIKASEKKLLQQKLETITAHTMIYSV